MIVKRFIWTTMLSGDEISANAIVVAFINSFIRASCVALNNAFLLDILLLELS